MNFIRAIRTLPRLALALFLMIGSASSVLRSQDLSRPDPGFGVNGVSVVTNGTPAFGGKVAIDSKGRIVVAAATIINSQGDILLIRYLPDGSLDSTFGSGGTVLLGSPTLVISVGLAIDEEDNIVVVHNLARTGYTDIVVTRLLGEGANPGAVDSTFGPNSGTYLLSTLNSTSAPTSGVAGGIAIQEDGRIVLAGTVFSPAATNSGDWDLVVVRLTAQGWVDPSFHGGQPAYFGFAAPEGANEVAIDSQGRILVSAAFNSFARIYRLTAAGNPDTTIGNNNGAFTALNAATMLGDTVQSFGIGIDSDDNVVMCGVQSGGDVTGSSKLWVAKYATDTYTPAWVTEEDYGADSEAAYDLSIQPDGKIVVCGYSSGGPGTAVIRYQSDGSRDTTFNSPYGGFAASLTGGSSEAATGLAIQSDGGIVLAGFNATSFFAARLGSARMVTNTALRFPSLRTARGSTTRSLKLSNAGNAQVAGLQLRIVGAGKRDYKILPPVTQAVAVGATSNLRVRFNPVRKGSRNTVILATTNNAGNATIRLRGRGR